MNRLYDRSKEYDLEHLGDDQDVRFYSSLKDSLHANIFPREFKLLFVHTGFEIEQMVGDYKGKPISSNSRIVVSLGRKNSRGHIRN